MTDRSQLRLDVSDVLRRGGTRRDVVVEALVPDMAAGLVRVPDGEPVRMQIALDSVTDGVVVHGTAEVAWSAECARCLEVFAGSTRAKVDELFENDPVEGETYPLEGHEIDLAQLVRDSLLVEFPLTPAPALGVDERCEHCGRTLDEVSLHEAPDDVDHRWDALRSLDL